MKTFHNSKKVIIDWIKFDSKVEWDYYLYLKSNPEVVEFKIQPKYLLLPKFEKNWEKFREMYYIADFLVITKDWSFVVDVKGMPTEQSKIKRKLFIYKYDIPMKRLVKYKWDRVDYFDNIKRRTNDKKKKKLLESDRNIEEILGNN